MKSILLSYASKGREDYRNGMLSLIDSALLHWKGDMKMYSPDHWLEEYKGVKITKEMPDDMLPHSEMPYQFKSAMIHDALKSGYERIVWLDTSITINKDLTPLFDDELGITCFHNLGHPLKNYISDDALKLLGNPQLEDVSINNGIVTVTDLIPQIWGGALLFNFKNMNTHGLFKDIQYFSTNGSFKDGGSTRKGFVAHRHDQAVMSVLLHNKCNLQPYGKIALKQHAISGEYGNDIYLIYGK